MKKLASDVYILVYNGRHPNVFPYHMKNVMFDIQQRIEMIQTVAEDCEVIQYNTMLPKIMTKLGVKYLVRGVRNNQDYAFEQELFMQLRKVNPEIEMVMLPADHNFVNISSTKVRNLLLTQSYDGGLSMQSFAGVENDVENSENECYNTKVGLNEFDHRSLESYVHPKIASLIKRFLKKSSNKPLPDA